MWFDSPVVECFAKKATAVNQSTLRKIAVKKVVATKDAGFISGVVLSRLRRRKGFFALA